MMPRSDKATKGVIFVSKYAKLSAKYSYYKHVYYTCTEHMLDTHALILNTHTLEAF